MGSFGVAVIATLYFTLQVGAQIPIKCADNYNPTDLGKCCPELSINDQPMGPCGSQAGRGKCVPVSDLCNVAYIKSAVEQDQDKECKNIADERLNWPSKLFSHVCNCSETYGDYDCGRCAYGYMEDSNFECVRISDPQPRRSITSLSEEEWKNYLDLLRKAKNTISTRYVVITGDDNELTNITTYDLFTWLHHYATKDHLEMGYLEDHSACDYAHQSTGFLTWHRFLLLWLERELQILSDNSTFRISYWDWTNTQERASMFERLFTSDRLGGKTDGSPEVTGNYFNSAAWKTICLNKCNEKCNPNDKSTIPLRRFPKDKDHYINANNNEWPLREDIEDAVNLDSFYDDELYNKYTKDSFANFVEGFVATDSNSCDEEEPFCNCDMRSCQPFARRFHNSVHIILGLNNPLKCNENCSKVNLTACTPRGSMDGAMVDVRASPNDPIFINHHAMIDLIFEMWLQQHPNTPYVGSQKDSRFPGHSAEDCAVPFIPVYTHSQAFKPAEEFGYSYTPLNSSPDSVIVSLPLVIASIMLTLITVLS